MRKLGYPTHQTLYQWLNQRDASHERKSGRPWSHYDPTLKAQAVAFVRSGMAGKDVAEMLGVSSSAVVYNWARAAEDPSPAAADKNPIEPIGDSGNLAQSPIPNAHKTALIQPQKHLQLQKTTNLPSNPTDDAPQFTL